MSSSFVERPANQLFPCLDPAHPEMRDIMQRMLTFHEVNWFRIGRGATSRDFAEAGFFFFGELLLSLNVNLLFVITLLCLAALFHPLANRCL